MRGERESICQYYESGVCLFMRDFPLAKAPSYASDMTMYLTPDIAKAFESNLNYRKPVYYCKSADIITRFPGAAQKEACDQYVPNEFRTISSR